MIAEKIGNRNVNIEEHENWEERLIRLGILERKLDKGKEQKESLRNAIKYDIENSDKTKDKDENQSKVLLESAIQKNAEQLYINTGMIPVGYKKDEQGKIVRITPKITIDERANRLSASKDKLSVSENNKKQKQAMYR